MPLARIITWSETCGQQLALDLVARGYAVEVVAPDSVPDNFADLVLRVGEDSGKLVASVEAHNGGRTASLDFVHHLRVPLADSRMPANVEVVCLSGGPASLEAGSSTEQVPLSADVPPLGIKAASPQQPSLSAARPDSDDPVPAISERSRLVETASLARTSVASVKGPTISPRQAVRLNRPSAWQWRAALATACMVSLALALALGGRRFEKTPVAVPQVDSEELAFPSIDSYSPAAAFENDPQKGRTNVPKAIFGLPALPSVAQRGGVADHMSKNSAATTAGDSVVRASIVDRTERSRRHDGLIARDTVIYLDGRGRPARKARVAKGIAANTVTYLSKPIPKPAK